MNSIEKLIDNLRNYRSFEEQELYLFNNGYFESTCPRCKRPFHCELTYKKGDKRKSYRRYCTPRSCEEYRTRLNKGSIFENCKSPYIEFFQNLLFVLIEQTPATTRFFSLVNDYVTRLFRSSSSSCFILETLNLTSRFRVLVLAPESASPTPFLFHVEEDKEKTIDRDYILNFLESLQLSKQVKLFTRSSLLADGHQVTNINGAEISHANDSRVSESIEGIVSELKEMIYPKNIRILTLLQKKQLAGCFEIGIELREILLGKIHAGVSFAEGLRQSVHESEEELTLFADEVFADMDQPLFSDSDSRGSMN